MAAIRSTYPIVKLLRADGYKIIDKVADDRLFFDEPDKGPDNSRDDFLKRRIDRIQIFKGMLDETFHIRRMYKQRTDFLLHRK